MTVDPDEARADRRWVTVPRMVLEAAQRFAGLEAVVGGTRRLSYPALAESMLRAGRAFLAAGLTPGDRVAIWAPNGPDWLIAAFGAMAAGGVIVPLNTRFRGGEAADILVRSRARILLCVNGFLGTEYLAWLRDTGSGRPDLAGTVVLEGEVPPDAVRWEDFLAAGDAVSPDRLSLRIDGARSDDLSDIIFTSGTTGRPKGVMCSQSQTLRVYADLSRLLALRPTDRCLVVVPFFHTFGYKGAALSCLMAGATVVPEAVFDVDRVLTTVQSERISVLPGPPTLFLSILNHPDRGRYDLSSLRCCITGAAAVPVELIRRVRNELGTDIVTGYGLTESTGSVALSRPGDVAETIARTSGRAIPGVEVRAVGPDGGEVATGAPGEIVVRGYNVMLGYLDDPPATAEAVNAGGWLHTGDIGTIDDRGYIQITDRTKDMFIVGGFNAYPAEIEGIMLRHPAIAQVAVIGVPDERLGEVPLAFVVPRPGAAPDTDEIIRWCRLEMANFKAPRHVRVVDSLPMTASGKVTKFTLRDLARHPPVVPSEASPTEQAGRKER